MTDRLDLYADEAACLLCFTISTGTLIRHALISPMLAASMCTIESFFKNGSWLDLLPCIDINLTASYVTKKTAAFGADPTAAGPIPA